VIPTGKKPISPNWVLGGVNVLIGHEILHDFTGEPVMTLPVGTFSADAVTNVGGGDHVAGRRALQKFVDNIRRQRPVLKL